MKDEHLAVRIHADACDLPQRKVRRELRPAVHNLIGLSPRRLRRRGESSDWGEKGEKANDPFHGVTVDESESVSQVRADGVNCRV